MLTSEEVHASPSLTFCGGCSLIAGSELGSTKTTLGDVAEFSCARMDVAGAMLPLGQAAVVRLWNSVGTNPAGEPE